MRISIIIPFHDEERNVEPVLDEVRRCHPDAEIIAIDDHSSDASFEILSRRSDIRLRRLPRWLGQSAALYCGLRMATGDVCVLLDGDGQSSAADIKLLLEHFPRHDVVIGRRVARQDRPARILASRIANGVRAWLTGDGIHDTGGTPKAMKRECIEQLVPFDGFHRFIPTLLNRAGFEVLEVPVAHRERLHGRSNYTYLRRAGRGLVDLAGISWLGRRRIDLRELELDIEPAGDGEAEPRR